MCDWISASWIKLCETWVFIKVSDMLEHLEFIPVILVAVVDVISPSSEVRLSWLGFLVYEV